MGNEAFTIDKKTLNQMTSIFDDFNNNYET